MSEIALSQNDLDYIFTPQAIRDRAKLVYEDAKAGRPRHQGAVDE